MIYLSSFSFSEKSVQNPNIYPYKIVVKKGEQILSFRPITVLYGNNASGKSTMLNVIVNRLSLEGSEYAISNKFGRVPWFSQFVSGCSYMLGEEEDGRMLRSLSKKQPLY